MIIVGACAEVEVEDKDEVEVEGPGMGTGTGCGGGGGGGITATVEVAGTGAIDEQVVKAYTFRARSGFHASEFAVPGLELVGVTITLFVDLCPFAMLLVRGLDPCSVAAEAEADRVSVGEGGPR